MAQITFTNKVALNENAGVADINKVKADDMNEIKSVVNNNDTAFQGLQTDFEEACTFSNTTEQIIGTWINGKPIYRKVVAVNFGASGSTSTTTNHNIANIDEVTHFYLKWYDTTDKVWYVNYRDIGATHYVFLNNVSTTSVMVMQSTLNWQGRTSNRYCVIEYTKTTD